MESNMGHQSIGCEVTGCSYHGESNNCEHNKIMVRPCQGCNNGQAEDETLCGSYRAK